MIKKLTDSVTKKVQKQQISSTIAVKYIDTLNIILTLLDNDINIQTLINVMVTMKKTNPSLVPFYWNKYVLNEEMIQKNLSSEKINIEFWSNTNFKNIFLNALNRNKWDDLGLVIIDRLQLMLKNDYSKNVKFKKMADEVIKNGMEVNKLVILYNNLQHL